MPQKITSWARLVPLTSGFIYGDVGYNRSNWVYYPRTKKPDRRVQNEHGFIASHYTYLEQFPNKYNVAWSPPGAQTAVRWHPGFSWTALENEALARFRGKLHKGGASLGVTLASWKQTREMVVHRLSRASNVFGERLNALVYDPKRLKRLQRDIRRGRRDPLANDVLEVEFGWRPLFADIHAAMMTACQLAIPLNWVRSAAKGEIAYNTREGNRGSSPWTVERWSGQARCTIAASVEVDNPNLWLANRLGLINPAVVAWDLVPWSFVVNMFVNVNQVLNSFTDEVGLNITNRSTTYSVVQDYYQHLYTDPYIPSSSKGEYPGQCVSILRQRYKSRTPGSFPRVQLMYKMPEVNWELALIASSLLLQRARRLNQLISF